MTDPKAPIHEYLARLNHQIKVHGGEFDPRTQEMVKEHKRIMDLLVSTEPLPAIMVTREMWEKIAPLTEKQR